MKKIISVVQNRNADAYTIENEPIASIDLMERASEAFVQEIEPLLNFQDKIAIFCGRGNNGGDGLAIARILLAKGYNVYAYLCQASKQLSDDCSKNALRFSYTAINSNVDIPLLSDFDVVIDALFGSGLSRPIEGIEAEVIKSINASVSKVYSVDIPSGLYCDTLPEGNAIVQADLVVSFQRPKRVFFYPESGEYIKDLKVVDIGLNEQFIESQESELFYTETSIQSLLKPQKRFSHKGIYGHCLLVGGSYGMMGAVQLSSKSALRSGAGLVTAYVPKCGYAIMQSAVPEIMCKTDRSYEYLTNQPNLESYSAIGIGPGLGTHSQTVKMLKSMLQTVSLPLVLDADALNCIAVNKEMLNLLPAETIITPHPKEFERLVGKWTDSLEREQKQLEFSKTYNTVVVFKDAYTCVSTPDGKLIYNTTGNAGMATAGSGDVLTGIITSLRGQGFCAEESAILGVYFHGKAGDAVAKERGERALIASDIIERIKISSYKL